MKGHHMKLHRIFETSYSAAQAVSDVLKYGSADEIIVRDDRGGNGSIRVTVSAPDREAVRLTLHPVRWTRID